MSGLVGESHQAALATLIGSYRRVNVGIGSADAGGPMVSELVVLSAPMGWGKTRVVQEFYAHLADTQPEDGRYWPPALVADIDRGPVLSARKKVVPGIFEVAANVELPYLWWGVSCQERPDARLANVVADDASQLVAHLGPALNRVEANRATRQAALGLARTLSAAAPFSDVPGMLDGLAGLGSGVRDLFRGLRDREADRSEMRTIDPAHHDRTLIETWVGALGSLLRRADAPLVVVVDDVHWADPASIEFFDEVLKSVPCLMVFTAWPDQLTIQERNRQRSDSGSLIDRWRDRLTICEIDRPGNLAAMELTASALGIETSHPLAAQLAKRADGNPLVLRLWAEVPLVQSAARAKEVLEPEDLMELPQDARAEFQRRWRDLPLLVQSVLAPAAQHGTTFVSALVAETLAAIGLLDQAAGNQAFAEAGDPHLWISDLGDETSQFTEPLLQEIAEGRVREILTAKQQRELNVAFNECLRRWRESDDWAGISPTGRRALLGRHLELTHVGEGGDPHGVIATYVGLADLQPETRTGWAEALAFVDCTIPLAAARDVEDDIDLRARKAELLQRLGRFGDALPLCEQTLTDSERILGPEHPRTLTSRNDLALCLDRLGRSGEALPFHVQTLTDSERLLGSEHPTTFISRSNLAGCLRALGRIDEALPLHVQTLTDSERLLGSEHPTTFISRSNLAGCLQALGRVDDALRLQMQILADRERILGVDNPDTVRSRNYVAGCLQELGRVDDALPVHEQTLTDHERIFGLDHPDTLTSRNDLALCLDRLGRSGEALSLHEQTLTDSERIFGLDHPNTLTFRNNHTLCLDRLGRVNEAFPLYVQTLTDSERLLGDDHPDTVRSRSNLAGCLQALGRLNDALPLHEQTLTDHERIFGLDHPDTLTSRNDLALCLDRLGRSGEALSLHEQTLTDSERIFGLDHPDTLSCRTNLAYCLLALRRIDEALLLCARTYADSERILGPDHPNTLASRSNLAACLEALDRTNDAERLEAGGQP